VKRELQANMGDLAHMQVRRAVADCACLYRQRLGVAAWCDIGGLAEASHVAFVGVVVVVAAVRPW
jgi:hypothetical protein